MVYRKSTWSYLNQNDDDDDDNLILIIAIAVSFGRWSKTAKYLATWKKTVTSAISSDN